MQRDEEELPPDDLDLSRTESPQSKSEFEELANLPPDEAVNSGEEAMDGETDTPDATDLDDADGRAVIRAIEDSLARTEGESPTSAAIPLPSPRVDDAPQVNSPEVSAEPVSLDSEGHAGAGAPTLLPVNWSPFMKLVLGNTPPPRAMEEGDVEHPWSTVQPPTAAETARHSPMLAIERMGGGGSAISVFVQVHLSDDAIRRVAEMTVREEASKSQHLTEVVAKRVFDIETGLFRLEAERRQLWR